MNRILIIDDDEELTDLVSEYLSAEDFETRAVHSGNEGLSAARTGNYDLAVLDVMLPGMNGFEVLKELRRSSDLPVLMLTARGDDDDRIVGLEIGADDYLPKPFNPRELLARMRAILRRVEGSVHEGLPERIVVDDVELISAARSVAVGGKPITLTSLEFDLLAALLNDAGKTVRKEDLSEKVLERKLSPYDRSLDMHISNLRKKLGLRADGTERIKTIRSAGYIYTVA
jgi:two-component system response regulator CpxR